MVGGSRLRLHEDAAPAILSDVFVQGVRGHPIERADLDERELLAEFEHAAIDDVRQLDRAKVPGLEQLPGSVPRTLNTIAKAGECALDQGFHVGQECVTAPVRLDDRRAIHLR